MYDQDLFDFTNENEEENILVQYSENTAPTDTIFGLHQNVPSFNCDFMENVEHFSEHGWLRMKELRLILNGVGINQNRNEVLVFGENHILDTLNNEFEFNTALNISRMNMLLVLTGTKWEMMQDNENMDYKSIRLKITSFFYQLRDVVCEIDSSLYIENKINLPFLERFEAIDNSILIKAFNNVPKNGCYSAGYHLIHGILDSRWLHLTILLKLIREQKRNYENIGLQKKTLEDTIFEDQLIQIICDLIILSINKFNMVNICEIYKSNCFPCLCIKECWVLIMHLCDELAISNETYNFWYYYNKVINRLQCEDENVKGEVSNRTTNFNRIITCNKNNNLFNVWLLASVSQLYDYDNSGMIRLVEKNRIHGNNYDLLYPLTKSFLDSDVSEENLRLYLICLYPILTEKWPENHDYLLLLWEYFSKRLNMSFHKQGTRLDFFAVIPESGLKYFELIKVEIDLKDQTIMNSSSYIVFVNIFGKILRQLKLASNISKIHRLTSRIFAKFTATKLLALSEQGIHNLLMFFLTIASETDLKESAFRLQDVMLQLMQQDLKYPNIVIKGYVAYMKFLLEENLSIDSFLEKFYKRWNCNHLFGDDSSSLQTFATDVKSILNETKVFDKGEYMLIDVWLSKYLKASSYIEQEKILKCLNLVSQELIDSTEMNDELILLILKRFELYVLPYIKDSFKLLCVENNDFNDTGLNWISSIAANITILLKKNANNSTQNFHNMLTFFCTPYPNNSQLLLKYLTKLLRNDFSDINSETLIHNWIKCAMLFPTTQEDLMQFTKVICCLDDIKNIYRVDTDKLYGASEPLMVFFSGLENSFRKSSGNERILLMEKINSILVNFEQIVSTYLQTNVAEKIRRIYCTIGIILYHCAPIIYVKGKISCTFNLLISQFILPRSILIEETLPSFNTVIAVNKIWALVIGGLSKLDYKTDPNIIKYLHDLIDKWLPLFKILKNDKLIAKPLISFAKLANPEIMALVLERICKSFLSVQGSQFHPHSETAIIILRETMRVMNDHNGKFEFIVTIIYPIFEHILKLQRLGAINKNVLLLLDIMIGNYTTMPENLRDAIDEALNSITKNYLTHYSIMYFGFLKRIANLYPEIIIKLIGKIKSHMEHYERVRGMGIDHKMRNELSDIENNLRRK